MRPDAFERLAQRLLREADFDSVNVTGKSGDGGIDGLGVYRLGLMSFPVFFQCKRYQGSVGSGAVRDFRGAMAGRGDKGLLITTGSFTTDAKKEAARDGAPPIDLIDGDRLCQLLKQYELGVRTVTRTVEDVSIDPVGLGNTIRGGDPVNIQVMHGECRNLAQRSHYVTVTLEDTPPGNK
jgi:restriction system protein